ncbi:MAG: hypothetical protein KAR20_16825, partial [Candidatus Heimdallarchaeota archaeon]|nr:hypothetical protein [Candidatus Heimdallarchaeota archaeon]
MNLEGIFIYKKAYPRRSKNPQVYIGHLDQKKEYYNLDLRVPEKEMMKIPCFIPSDLVRREDLNSKNLRLRGVVEYDPVNDRKIFMAEHVDVCDIKYIEVGPPALGNYEDIFTYVYERQREVFEGEPTLLFAGLIGSDVGSSYTSDENPGCGVGIGIVEEASSGSGRIPIATKNVLRDFSYFVRRISPVRINSQNPSFEWWRYVSTNLSGDVASRKLKNEKEIDWNVISNVKEISASR